MLVVVLELVGVDVGGSGCRDRRIGRYQLVGFSAQTVQTNTYRGRHTGTFMGVPASGNEIEMHSIDIWRVSDGRLAEHWDELNTLELFQQIGAIPELP